MTPPNLVGSFSPVNNNMCDQNQVAPQLDALPQDLPLSPMQPQAQLSPSASQQQQQQQQQGPQQPSQSQLNEMPNMVDSIVVPLQQNIIDPYRRTGKLKIIIESFFFIGNLLSLLIFYSIQLTDPLLIIIR